MPITTDEEYGKALAELRALWGFGTDTQEHKRLVELGVAIYDYEVRNGILNREQEIFLKRRTIFRYASELGMLLNIDKADVRNAILSVLPEKSRCEIGDYDITGTVDYRTLLKKYIRHVEEVFYDTGCVSGVEFTDAERSALQELEQEGDAKAE